MKEKTRDLIKEYMRSHSRRRQVLIALASIVVFVTTYALVLPALTLDKDEAASQGGIGVQSSGQAVDANEEADANPVADENAADADNKDEEAIEDSSESDRTKTDKEAASDTASKGSVEKQDAKEKSTSDEPLTYEDKKIKVTATPHDTEIPEGAVLEVTEITSDMRAYDAYFKALNRGFKDNPYDGDNSLLYDVSIMVDGAEYEPENDSIEIQLDFKKNQLSSLLDEKLSEDASLRVIHLPIKGATQSSATENVKASQIEKDYISDITVDTENTESVSFALESLSVITVTGASTDVVVTGALQGTTMKSMAYNVYAYLVSETGGDAYGVKINFVNGQFSGTIANVPVDTYKLVLAYKPNNQELQEGKWNKNNVYECNVVEESGQYIFGYSSVMPADKTISPSDNTVGFTLEVSDVQINVSVATLMDRAINYGIVANDIKYSVRSYTNFATKHIDISNSNDSTIYSSRADGIDVVPNIIADIDHNGQPMSTQDKDANYYVTDEDKGKVSSQNTEETIVRNKNEIEDRVEIMISNTLKQAEQLAKNPDVTLPSGLISVDVSPYGENATIVLDATNISGEQNGFTIVKRPGQTIVFNINGQNAAPPQNIKIKLVNENGEQIGDTYVAGDEMRNAPASDGDVWNKIIWNFPDATSVTATNQVGGIFLVPKGDFNAANKGGGWIVARGKVTVTNEWYGFPGSDEPFKQKIIRKTFVGIESSDIDPNYALKLWTHTNESTAGTTNEQLITTLVLKPDSDESLIKDPTGANDQTGYMTTGTDANGNVFYEWKTPSISVGNEHQLTEINSTGKSNQKVELVEFVAPISGWSESAQNYVWEQRTTTYGSEEEFDGVFNVSSHNEDYRQYVYVTNNYSVDKTPHDLTLTKNVSDPDGLEPANQQYEFEIELKNSDNTALSGEISYKINNGVTQTKPLVDGKMTINLKKNETIQLLQLPFGTKYTISEKNLPDKCNVAFSGDTTKYDEGAGTVVSDRSVTATNTYSDGPGKGTLTVTKTVVDYTEDGGAAPGQFIFTVKNSSGNYVDVNGEETTDSNQYEFRINDGQTVNFNNWPVDTYTISEKDASSEREEVTWTVTIGGDATAAGRVSVAKGGTANVTLTNTYSESGLRVTKKWLASDGETDISAAVERTSVKFKLYVSYSGNTGPADKYISDKNTYTYTISRNSLGKWTPVAIELPSNPWGWGQEDGYYIVELDESGQPIENSSLIAYDLNGNVVDKTHLLTKDSVGKITITNKEEEKKNEIDVVKKWEGSFSDAEKTAQVQLKGVKTAGGEKATFKITGVSAWGQGDKIRYSTSQYSDGEEIHIGDKVQVTYSDYTYEIHGTKGIKDFSDKSSSPNRVWEFEITEETAVVETNASEGNTYVVTKLSGGDSVSPETTVENIGDPVTLSASNNWYHKWSGITGGYSSYYVEELNPASGVTVTYTYKDEAVPAEGIKKGTIVVTNSKSNADTTDFEFTKIWKDISDQDVEWQSNITISLYKLVDRQSTKVEDFTLSAEGGSEGDYTWTATPSHDGKWTTFKIEGLPASDSSGNKITYYVIEGQVSGYEAPEYYQIITSQGGGNTAAVAKTTDTDRALDGDAVINRPEGSVELPMTGGSGTSVYYIFGGLLAIASVTLILLRKRVLGQSVARNNR